MQLPQFQAGVQPDIQAALKRQLDLVQVPELREACSHLLGRGKLFRPLLILATYKAVTGENPQRFVSVASVLEILHTSTLIHDDLPCLDDAGLRRGVETVHLAHGEDMALMAGDMLINLATKSLLAETAGLNPAIRLQLVTVLNQAIHDVIEGQVLDILGEQRQLSLAELEVLHSKKTGALLGACCEFGAILAGADEELTGKLRQIGVQIGLAFQVRDDLLSATGDEAVVGKTLSSDERLDKSTYVSLLGVEGAVEYGRGVAEKTRAAITGLELREPGLLLEVADKAVNRDR